MIALGGLVVLSKLLSNRDKDVDCPCDPRGSPHMLVRSTISRKKVLKAYRFVLRGLSR